MRAYIFVFIISFALLLTSCTSNTGEIKNNSEPQFSYSSIVQSVEVSSSRNSSNVERKVELFTKNGTTIKVGDSIMLSVIHSPTNMTGVDVEYFISNENIAQFVYDEESRAYKKYPSNCTIEAKALGEFQVQVFVKSNDGNCSDSITITVVE